LTYPSEKIVQSDLKEASRRLRRCLLFKKRRRSKWAHKGRRWKFLERKPYERV